MRRRTFFKNSLLVTSGTLFIDSFLGCVNPSLQEGNLDEYFKGFQDPPAGSRLFVRWWWNGNRLTSEEILRELDVMQAAGIGGVEINPIAFPQGSDPAGYKALTIFEESWLDMLEVALQGAKERGMICDMIVGSGWPFGGEFLEKEDQSQMVTIETIDLEGGRSYSFSQVELLDRVDPQIHSMNKKVYKELLMARLLPKTSNVFTEGEDLMGSIRDNILQIDVPAGNFVLYYVVKLSGYMAVINGAPGAAGPVLNHYSRAATENYLNRISDSISSRIGNMGDSIRAMFCDSMELEGANWNDDLPREFEARRGYSILPYFPFVLKKVGHMGNPLDEDYGTTFPEEVHDLISRVELDFYLTRIELFKERFMDTFNAWCRRNNVLSRMQAYGRGMHPLEASMEIDIPECETWLFREVGQFYPHTGLVGRAPRMCNKYVASGAALAGKTVVSCEEITNTAMAFMATLEHIKIAGDQSNISGVNHSILHGFNYSPPDVPFPGWVRYGTYFNEQNTWWPHFRKWSDYKARISYLMQNATPRANVAILQPLTDLWLKHGPQRDPFPRRWYPEYQNNLWEAIHQNGGGCDYVSENIIKGASIANGLMRFGARSYDTLLLPEIETLNPETARFLAAFADSGGKIIFIGKQPFKSAAYSDADKKDSAVKREIDTLLERSDGNVHLYPAPQGDPVKWYQKLHDDLGMKPYTSFAQSHPFLSQSSYELGGMPVFFLANTSLNEDIPVRAEFHVDNSLTPWIWNPETGERLCYSTTGNKRQIDLVLPRATSLLIVFEKTSEGDFYEPLEPATGGKEIPGPWKLKLHHMNGSKRQVEVDALTDLLDIAEAKDFAGTVIYEKHFDMGQTDGLQIDLGKVQGVTELILNGTSLGTRWYGVHVYNIGDALREGENVLTIKLTTIIGNYVKSLKDNPVAQRWTGRQEYYPMGVFGPVRLF
jgi:hypothetical protein